MRQNYGTPGDGFGLIIVVMLASFAALFLEAYLKCT